MNITNSPDLTNLEVAVRWDLSGSLPNIYLENLSTGSGLANVDYAFVATSPSGTFIHDGDIGTPDKTGIWSNTTLTDSWPRPFNAIEYSGAPYSLYVIAKDSAGNVYTTVPQTAAICRPNGNTQNSKNYFGIASSNVNVRCQEARVFFQDTTYHSYRGMDGERVGSTLKVIYPVDESGNIPTAFTIADFTTALVPITYSSPNYQFLQTVIYDYDLGNDTTVRIKYQVIETFGVWCNIDLGALVCEYNKFIDSIENGSCGDVQDAKDKLAIISPKMTLVMIGIMQPLTGVDVPSLIKQIEDVNAFDCNCCSVATGIIPTTSSVIDGYNFTVNKLGGDVAGSFSNDGTNIVLNIGDVSYVVTMSNDSPSQTTAFSFVPSSTTYQKTYALKIDVNQFAYDILNNIKSDSGLVNLFNSIVNVSGNGNLLVDGKCIFSTSASCDYTFTIASVPSSTTFAILTGINAVSLNFAFNETNLPALQTYLNGIGLGTFAVTNPSPNVVLITSTTNTNTLTSISYNVASTSYLANMTRNCTGYTPISATTAVQNLINYLCNINDSDIETSQDYEICYIDPISKLQKSVTISSGAALGDFISELLARGCDTINYVISLNSLSCQSVTNLFPSSINILQNTDYITGTKGGVCARITPVELATRQIQLGMYDLTYMATLCAAVAQCGAGKMCDPFNYFYLTVPYSSPSDNTMNIVVNFQHPTAISYTLRYARVDNTGNSSYITIPSVMTSPFVISGLDDGQYVIGLTPVYSDGRKCSEVTQTTPSCSGINSFSSVLGGSPTGFVVSYSAVGSIPKVRVNIAYPNGGGFSQIYTNDGTDIDINTPSGVYGDFSITMQPVCNETTGFFGIATAPVIVTVSNPNPIVSPLSVSLARTGSVGGGSLSAFVSGGMPPYSYTFSYVYTGACGSCTIDNPSGVVSSMGDPIGSTFSCVAYAGTTYQLVCSITDGASNTAVSNSVSTPMCLVLCSKIKLFDGSEKSLGELTVGEQLFGDGNFVEYLSNSMTNTLYSFNGGLLESTDGHIHIVNGEQVHALDIIKGSHFADVLGKEIEISDIEIKEGSFEVRDMVTTNHTYYANGILTHNKFACP